MTGEEFQVVNHYENFTLKKRKGRWSEKVIQIFKVKQEEAAKNVRVGPAGRLTGRSERGRSAREDSESIDP